MKKMKSYLKYFIICVNSPKIGCCKNTSKDLNFCADQ